MIMLRRASTTAALLALLALVLPAREVVAQTASGRSNAGPISPSYEDPRAMTPLASLPLSFQVEFTEPSGNNYLDARETGRLRLKITNAGRLPVRNVIARVVPLSPPSSLSYSDSIVVGDVPAGSTRYAIFYFAARDEVPAQIVTFQVELADSRGPVADPRLLTFLTRPRVETEPR